MDTSEIENPFGFVWLQLCINFNDKVAGKCESNCCEDACSIKRRIEINIFRLETNSNDVNELRLSQKPQLYKVRSAFYEILGKTS